MVTPHMSRNLSNQEATVITQQSGEVPKKSTSLQVFEAISIKQSLYSLTKPRKYEYDGQEADGLKVLEGIRAFACLWMLMYFCGQCAGLMNTNNPWDQIDKLSTLSYSLIEACHLALDEFFMLAAFLLCIKMIPYMRRAEKREIEEGEKQETFKVHTSIPQLFLWRLLRLAPLYLVVFFASWTLMPFFSSGPFWYLFERNF